MNSKHGVAAAFVGVAIACTACGGGGTAQNQQAGVAPQAKAAAVARTAALGSVKACDLISTEDLIRITGKKLVAGQLISDETYVSQCGWSAAEGGGGGIAITFYHTGGTTALTNMKAAAGNNTVAGIGDEAFWYPTLDTLMARKGDRGISLAFHYPGEHAKEAEEIGRIAVGKM